MYIHSWTSQALILRSSFSKAHRIVFFLRNIALVYLSTIFHFVLNVNGLTTANAEEQVLHNSTFLLGVSQTCSSARFGVQGEMWGQCLYGPYTNRLWRCGLNYAYCLNSRWIHLWTWLMKFAFLTRSDVLEASVVFSTHSLDIQSSVNSIIIQCTYKSK